MITAQRQFQLVPGPLPGVSPDAWSRFKSALEVQAPNAVSASHGYGAYAMPARRLVELGYASNARRMQTSAGRWVWDCDFILPWTKTRFLTDTLAQFVAFSKSISLYHHDLMSGDIQKPAGSTLAGCLVVLHVGGRGALKAWPDLFEHTRALHDRVKELF